MNKNKDNLQFKSSWSWIPKDIKVNNRFQKYVEVYQWIPKFVKEKTQNNIKSVEVQNNNSKDL